MEANECTMPEHGKIDAPHACCRPQIIQPHTPKPGITEQAFWSDLKVWRVASRNTLNCLIGCMACQLACPVNKGFFDWFDEGVSFTEEETALLLYGIPPGQLSQVTADKLQRLGLLEDVDLVTRNLAALLKQRSA